AHAGHVVVADHDVSAVTGQQLEGGGRIARGHDAKVVDGECALEQHQIVLVVVDQQHYGPLFRRGRARVLQPAALGQRLRAGVRGERARKAISLQLVAAVGPQKVELPFGFDTFGDHLEAHAVGEIDNGDSQRRIVRVADRLTYESPFDLERVERETLQVRQAGIARAEVVHREPHAQGLQLARHLQGFLGIAHEQRFGDLELDQFRRDFRFAQYLLDHDYQILVLKLQRRQIDRNRPRFDAALFPAPDLLADAAQDPFAHLHDQSRLF